MSLIERIEITRHRLSLDPAFPAAWDPEPRRAFPVTVVRVHDDEGRVGIGAGDPMRGVVDYLDLLLGRDPLDLCRHAAILSNIAFHDGRPWPLDTALWDLVGKVEGRPIWRMLGGASDRIRPYASWGMHRSVADSARRAADAVAAGFGALKLRFGSPGGLGADFEVLAAVREAVGPDVGLMVDCNQGWRMPWDTVSPWTFDDALPVAERLAPFDVTWMEEPLHRGDHIGMARLRAASPVPIAGGEMTRELHELHLMLEAGCLDVYQPDVVLTGGMTGLADLARLVVDRGHIFTPHTWGSGIALVANAHLTAGTVGTPFLEYPWDPPEWTPERRDFLLTEPIIPAAGWIMLGDAPGLGVDLDDERLESTRTDHAGYG